MECFPGEQTEFKINTVANRQPVNIQPHLNHFAELRCDVSLLIVIHKKRGSTFVIITFENLDGF